jgi:hypothetical protein
VKLWIWPTVVHFQSLTWLAVSKTTFIHIVEGEIGYWRSEITGGNFLWSLVEELESVYERYYSTDNFHITTRVGRACA